jgi:hypothetical protein
MKPSHHQVSGLRKAQQVSGPPFATRRAAKGAPGRGVAYERVLGNALPGLRRGLWWYFVDDSGEHFCQTDLVKVGLTRTLIIESKLSWTAEGHEQLERLYEPVLGLALGKPCVGILACKHLRGGARNARIFSNVVDAVKWKIEHPRDRVVWHYLGIGVRHGRTQVGNAKAAAQLVIRAAEGA